MSTLRDRLTDVRAGIEQAVADAGSATAPELIVVTKFHPVSLIRELFELGVRDFGENRHQEAKEKSVELADLDLRWHFVGQLQSKKARQARAYTRVIHSMDRDSLIDALAVGTDGIDAPPVDVFVQVNLTRDEGRGGVDEDDLERMTERVLGAPGQHLLGVMAVAPLGEDPRRAFARLGALSTRMQALDPSARFISAGMSGDYREAILEGATHLRIGSAITGNRPTGG